MTGEAVRIVAERMLQRYASEYDADHMSWRDFEADARGDLDAVAPLLIADALDQAAEQVVIPGASSLAAAWLQGRASRYRSEALVERQGVELR